MSEGRPAPGLCVGDGWENARSGLRPGAGFQQGGRGEECVWGASRAAFLPLRMESADCPARLRAALAGGSVSPWSHLAQGHCVTLHLFAGCVRRPPRTASGGLVFPA